MKIALDGMGGDHPNGAVDVVKAAVHAARDLNIEILLVGDSQKLGQILAKNPFYKVTIVAAADVISMGEKDLMIAARRRPEASMNVGMKLVKSGQAAAFVSAGNSGALLASASVHLKRIHGIERAAFGSVSPYNQGRLFLVDIGSNTDCRPSQLADFGLMGKIYAQDILGLSDPRIGLLGSQLENLFDESPSEHELERQQALILMENLGLNVVGFIDPSKAHRNIVDVLVADGFTGNAALKIGEGTMDYFHREIRWVFKSNPIYLAFGLLMKPTIKKRLGGGDGHSSMGGAYLIGVDGVVVKAHGRSDEVALTNAIRLAHTAVVKNLVTTIASSVKTLKTKRETVAV